MKAKTGKPFMGWVLYDWANSAFATSVMAGFFPIFFKNYWSKDIPATESTFWLGVSLSTSGILVAILAPILGAFADQAFRKKIYLFFFALLGILATLSFYFIGEGQWQLAAIGYTIATVGFLGGNIFYDSLIVSVATPDDFDVVSGWGYALGYVGGGVLFLVHVLMVTTPEMFGLTSTVEAVKIAFLSVSVWWALFSIPLFFWVKEKGAVSLGKTSRKIIKDGFRELFQTLRSVAGYKPVAIFLVAYWLYIDGVDTIIAMAVDYGKSIGIEDDILMTALLLVQFVAFPFALLFGYLGKWFGAKPMILLCIVVYIFITIISSGLTNEAIDIFGFLIHPFYLVALLVASVQGGIQSLSRSLFAALIPPEKSGEFFGFYNMIGKFATIIGPLMIGWVGILSGSPRIGILSVSILFLLGGVLLLRIPSRRKVDADV